jgi:hypothetical protein
VSIVVSVAQTASMASSPPPPPTTTAAAIAFVTSGLFGLQMGAKTRKQIQIAMRDDRSEDRYRPLLRTYEEHLRKINELAAPLLAVRPLTLCSAHCLTASPPTTHHPPPTLAWQLAKGASPPSFQMMYVLAAPKGGSGMPLYSTAVGPYHIRSCLLTQLKVSTSPAWVGLRPTPTRGSTLSAIQQC